MCLTVPCPPPVFFIMSLRSLALFCPAAHRVLRTACVLRMSTVPAPLPENSIKELVGDASTTESLLACKIGGCCGKDTPLLPLPVSSILPIAQLYHRNKTRPALHRRSMTGSRPSHSGDSPKTRQ